MESSALSKKVLFSVGLMSAGLAFAGNSRPNVLVIYTDDQGTLDVGCFGATDLYTPNMDALAGRGVKFTQFYAAPVSSASRAALMTGQFACRNGIYGIVQDDGLDGFKETMAERFLANGYQTACIGKWHLGRRSDCLPNNQGFEYFWGFRGGCIDNFSHFTYWKGPNRHDLWKNEREVFEPGTFFAQATVRELKNYILERDKSKPFFAYWALNIPHYPLQPKESWLEYYSNLENPRRMYCAFMSTLDDYLGEMMTFLQSEGLLEDTIIIFQSDNGHSTEERTFGGGGYCGEYRGAKFSLFEGGIRVPAIISWPGHIPEGESRDQMAMNIDWYPTLMDYCGIDYSDAALDGLSLKQVLGNARAKSPHQTLFFDTNPDRWAVRHGDWKLLNNPTDALPNDVRNHIPGYFLVNLKDDPSERTNLAEKYPEKVKELEKLRENRVLYEAGVK